MKINNNIYRLCALGALTVIALSGVGCSRMQPDADVVARISPSPPADMKPGLTPQGGNSESPTGGGAGGSAAAGFEAGRDSGATPAPTTPVQPAGITYSRMSPVDSDGSSIADRGHPIPPDQPLVPSNAKDVSQPLYNEPQQLAPNVKTYK